MKKKLSSKRPSIRSSPVIALLTDFGLRDHYVGTMKGVIAEISPKARVIDITHDVAPHQVREAGYLLWSSYKVFPKGTIFVCVVDPGVGSNRKIIVVKSSHCTWIAPDNGLLDLVLSEAKITEAVEIHQEKLKRFASSKISPTFHGRDIFAPIAAHLSLGARLKEMGERKRLPEVQSPFLRSKDDPTKPAILHVDHFGNVITNIVAESVEQLSRLFSVVSLGKGLVSTWIKNYSEAPEKTPCLIIGSSGLLEIVVKNDSAARLLGVHAQTSLKVYWH